MLFTLMRLLVHITASPGRLWQRSLISFQVLKQSCIDISCSAIIIERFIMDVVSSGDKKHSCCQESVHLTYRSIGRCKRHFNMLNRLGVSLV